MAETIYVKGINTFPKNDKAPDFVLGSGVITPNVLIAFIKEHQEHLTEYKGEKQLKVNFLKGRNGQINITLDTFKPEAKEVQTESIPVRSEQVDDDLPF